MEEQPSRRFEIKKKFGNPLKRILVIDDSQESNEAMAFIDRLGISYTLERSKETGKNMEEVFPRILVVKNGADLEGLKAIKFFRWELEPSINESTEDPEGAERVTQAFEEIDRELEKEGFFEEREKEGFV